MAEAIEDDEVYIGIDNEPVEVDQYSIALNIPDNQMRIQFHSEFGAVSSFIASAPEAYEFAQRILRGYDKLEGI